MIQIKNTWMQDPNENIHATYVQLHKNSYIHFIQKKNQMFSLKEKYIHATYVHFRGKMFNK